MDPRTNPGLTKVGHGLAKGLGIKLNYRNPTNEPNEKVTRGESTYSVQSADSYVEEEPHAIDWFREHSPSGAGFVRYLISLFPFLKWIHRYNGRWFLGDFIAGVTIGMVVIPQSMSYASLAEVPPQYGLYSSFMGVIIYWFFATSKDITIGPVAVMSTLTGDVVLKAANLGYENHVIASALAIVVGGIICFLGLVRIGWIAELIPLVAISAFMTGSAIFIAVGQVPNLMGIARADLYDTRAETYRVIINTLKYLGYTTIDAALGLTALFMLYAIRSGFNYLARRQPHRAKFWYIVNTMRTAFVILFYVMISAVTQLDLPRTDDGKDAATFAILGPVPRGFQHAAVPKINNEIISSFASFLPAGVIVMLIEHISISKSFGRINGYTINPSQEMVAIGVTNLLGPFLGAYPATGSFSRTAIKSKAGVRTPLAGVITGIVVLISIYALPPVFFYIPSAALSAVIIHAVGDLITPPNVVYQFWRVSPWEVPIFFAGVILTIFTSIEDGVYLTLCASIALILFRMLKAKGRFLGRVQVHSVIGDQYVDGDEAIPAGNKKKDDDDAHSRSIFVPLANEDGSNPALQATHPYPGIFIYRFSENFNYPNANHYLEHMVHEIFQRTQRTNPHSYPRPGDRPWNDPGPRKKDEQVLARDDRPTLKAIIMDMASVNNMDVTSTQVLIDVRNQLDKYAAPDKVQWHFANINNRWAKRSLTAAGFGFATPDDPLFSRWKPIFDVAEIGGASGAAADAETRLNRRLTQTDVEAQKTVVSREVDSINGSDDSNNGNGYHKSGGHARAAVSGMNRPFFHADLTSALQAAINNTESLKVEPVRGIDGYGTNPIEVPEKIAIDPK